VGIATSLAGFPCLLTFLHHVFNKSEKKLKTKGIRISEKIINTSWQEYTIYASQPVGQEPDRFLTPGFKLIIITLLTSLWAEQPQMDHDFKADGDESEIKFFYSGPSLLLLFFVSLVSALQPVSFIKGISV